jgi:hypothetical protein
MTLPILQDIVDAIRKFALWIWKEVKWVYGAIIAFVLVPINYLLDTLSDFLTYANDKWAQFDAYLQATGIFDIGGFWSSASSSLAMANTLFPINFAVVVFLALCAVWVLAALVRLVMKWVSWG